MSGAEQSAQWRLEPSWPLLGLAWGTLLGVGTATFPFVLAMLTGGEVPTLDSDWVVPAFWVGLLAVVGAVYGAVVGLVTGLVVMLVVGRDPAKRAARRTRATMALLVVPIAALCLWWL